MSAPKQLLKRKDSGITSLRKSYANSFPILFKAIEQFVIPERIEAYNIFINEEIKKNPLLFNASEIDKSLHQMRKEMKDKKKEKAKVNVVERKTKLSIKMRESIVDRHYFNQSIEDFKEPTNDLNSHLIELQKHLEFEKQFNASTIRNKVFVSKTV